MKRKFTVKAAAVLLSSSILFTSCLGSFNLTKKLYSWNQTVDNDQWVNELVFLVLSVTGYPVAVFIDSIILNSIEFWTGENPAETVQVKQIKTENGVFTVTTDANGHKIQKEGSDEVVTFRFDAENSSWSLEAMGQSTTLVQFAGDNQAKVYLADGSTMTVGADRAGVWALKQVVANRMYFANK